MNSITQVITASVESISQSDLYMTVKARMFTVPDANLNGCRCTQAFLDQIVSNREKYVGLPLNVDITNLRIGNYEKLGHMYNRRTGEFKSTMIGSFNEFEKEDLGDGKFALVSYARVPKRNTAICGAIAQLFAENNLKFSFEVNCGEYEKLDDGTILIDASDKNWIQGEAIVWSPACPQAVALELVAELQTLQNNDLEKGDEDAMNIDETKIQEIEVVAEEVVEDTIEEVAEQTIEVAEAEAVEETPEVSIAETETAESTETAEVVVHETHVEVDEVHIFDTDTCESVEDRTVHEVHTTQVIPDATIVIECECAEQTEEPETTDDQPETVEEETEPTEVDDVEDASCKKHAECEEDNGKEDVCGQEVSECNEDRYAEVIAELKKSIETLRSEIAEMKKDRDDTVVAEVINASASTVINPFMADISSASSPRSNLFEKAEKKNDIRKSLFERY